MRFFVLLTLDMNKLDLLNKLNSINKGSLEKTLEIEFIDIGKDFLVAASDHISIGQIAERIISNLNSRSNIEVSDNKNSKKLNYLIDTSAALEFGLKSESMLEIIDTVCNSK